MRKAVVRLGSSWLVAAAVLVAVTAAASVGFASAAPSHAGRHVRFVAALGPVRRAALPKGPAHWVASWSAAPMAPPPNTLGATGFTDQTVRNIVYTSAAGTKVRVLVTNAFGTRPLDVGHAAIAVRGKAAATGSEIPLTFRHRRSVVIKPGAAVLTDPVALQVEPLQELAVSLFLPRATGPATEHAVAQQVNYVADGDHVLDRGGGAFTTKTFSWYYAASVDVLAPARNLGTLVALGDSITDGVNSSTNTNGRWPNDLARRLHPRTGETLSVVDEGIGGNRLLNTAPCCGASALARFKRDVLHRAGVREVILLEGVNDIDQSEHSGALSAPHNPISTDQIIAGYRRLIATAHAAHLRILGGTILPFRGARYWTSAGEAKREAVNDWILHGGAFDGVINFSDAVEDPGVPTMLNPAYDSGDHLHPNRRGYQAMANAVDLKMLMAQAG